MPSIRSNHACFIVKSPIVNARFLTQPVTGVQRHAIEVSKWLRRMDRSIRFLSPRGVIHRELAAQLGAEQVGRFTGHVWEQFELNQHVGASPLIGLCNAGPLYRRRQVVTLHDAAPFSVPEAYSLLYRSWYKFSATALGRRAHTVMTDSEFSKQELREQVGIVPSKIQVVSLGHEHVFDHAADHSIITRNGLGDGPFLLAVGSRSPHKNFAALVHALERIGAVDFRVVIAGGINPRVHAGSADNTLPGNVSHIGFVTDAELRALYEQAAAYVHPAYYEGFGLPPLEAMALGCPVICSNAASLSEVCGEAAAYFDPRDVAALASIIVAVMSDDARRKQLSELGRARARDFRWKRSAQRILELAQSVGCG